MVISDQHNAWEIEFVSIKKTMAIISHETGQLEYQPVSAVFITVLLTAFSFLTAFSIRDTVIEIIYRFAPDHSNKKLFINIFFMFMFLFITVTLAYIFQDAVKSP